MGLYAGENIKKHEFVGEYKGEVITNGEADRRGAVYEKQNSTYLFSLNTKQEVDSNFYGNKIRFVNHRNRAGANLYPLIVLVNSVHRIGLFAQHVLRSVVGVVVAVGSGKDDDDEFHGGSCLATAAGTTLVWRG